MFCVWWWVGRGGLLFPVGAAYGTTLKNHRKSLEFNGFALFWLEGGRRGRVAPESMDFEGGHGEIFGVRGYGRT